MLRKVLIVFVLISFYNCKEKENEIGTIMSAEDIIKKSIEVAGGSNFERSDINFDFREIHYRALRNRGIFQLERHFKDSISDIKDVLSNSGFERFSDAQKIQVSDSLAALYSASVNSVHYFSVLPYGLDGKAVHQTYLGSKEIKGKDYHKIKITFSEEGGGEDFDDEFIYWIDKEKFVINYLAYSYKELDGSLGLRFREAYNSRRIAGLHFVDYNNFKTTTSDVDLEDLDDLFITEKLQLLSKIELKNIEVKLLN